MTTTEARDPADSPPEGRLVPHHRVAVIGAGFGGLGMALRLRERGERDFVVLERSDRVGGVWRENTYPGAACDVPSHLYSYSFAQPRWSRRYSSQGEILAYLEDLVAAHGLRRHLRFGAAVDTATWDGRAGRWHLALSDGTAVTASVVVSAVGQLTRPALPDIAGRDDYTGWTWHSAEWNHERDLTGRRVAVIGTGTSAIQFVPEVAEVAARVDVYQRSAPYVLPKVDHTYDGRRALANAPLVARLDRFKIFLTGELLTSAYVASESMTRYVTAQWRRHLETELTEPALRARATPDYTVGCKRIAFSNNWYPTIARPNVDLVTDRIARITPKGIRTADGTERAVDAIIYGTGFGATGFLQPMDVVGRDGQSLQASWQAEGPEAFAGVAVAGFPNFFMLYGPNSNLGANSIIYMLETQIAYVAEALDVLEAGRVTWLDVRGDVQAADNRWLVAASERTTYRSGCHSWYTNASGRNINNWPTFTFRYRRKLRHLDLADFDVQPAVAS